ncbi:hypothetical protein BJ508DRAFT_333052 [Ascobolus immersus RN42]|uniref:Uncharacterized protein n=1 Tax=Ascobolus immersus RN42 TaxID=1160509 RepID=A0A3N4HPR0_ASCIM|nr:hypothetical protein BJ508DRAFT_333052 [Ascobolus immersus RN42]
MATTPTHTVTSSDDLPLFAIFKHPIITIRYLFSSHHFERNRSEKIANMIVTILMAVFFVTEGVMKYYSFVTVNKDQYWCFFGLSLVLSIFGVLYLNIPYTNERRRRTARVIAVIFLFLAYVFDWLRDLQGTSGTSEVQKNLGIASGFFKIVAIPLCGLVQALFGVENLWSFQKDRNSGKKNDDQDLPAPGSSEELDEMEAGTRRPTARNATSYAPSSISSASANRSGSRIFGAITSTATFFQNMPGALSRTVSVATTNREGPSERPLLGEAGRSLTAPVRPSDLEGQGGRGAGEHGAWRGTSDSYDHYGGAYWPH